MSEKERREPSIIVGRVKETPLDDGGSSVEVLVCSDGDEVSTREIVESIAGVELNLVSSGVVRSDTRKSRVGIGYSGRWNSSWDPKGPERTEDGMILQ